MRIRYPPGRSGRLWLQGRLSVADPRPASKPWSAKSGDC